MKTAIEMAREAGLLYHIPFPSDSHVTVALHRFANLARAGERDALVESIDWTALMRQGELVTWGDAEELGDRVVAAIRARGQA